MRPLLPLAAAALLLACGHVRPGPTSAATATATATPTPAPTSTADAPTPTPTAPPPNPNAIQAKARADVLVSRARVLREAGDVAGAMARLEAALQVASGSEGARLELADLLVADGRDLDRAEALLAPVRDAGDGRLCLVLGRLAEARGDDAGAVAAYGEALAVADDPDVRLRRALALERLGRPGEAVAELERLRADRPTDPVARGRLAELYEAAGRLHEAEAELRWLAELQPERATGWDRLARFYERTGRQREAREAAGRARATAGVRPERALRPLLPSKS